MDSNSENSVKYLYMFTLEDGSELDFTLSMSSDRMKILYVEDDFDEEDKPHWTRLKYFQCENCPLDEKEYPRCPLAESITGIVEAFKDVPSTEIVDVKVVTPERTVSSRLQVQQALGSLMGINMAVSGCPILQKFAPMAKFHLPFATVEETMYRTISNYLLSQYFILQDGGEPDWDLSKLRVFYEDVEKVNRAVCNRIRSISPRDANVNAVIILDDFAKNVTYLMEQVLKSIKPIFTENPEK